MGTHIQAHGAVLPCSACGESPQVGMPVRRGVAARAQHICCTCVAHVLHVRCTFDAPGGNRTPDLQLRRLPLYPTELLAHWTWVICAKRRKQQYASARRGVRTPAYHFHVMARIPDTPRVTTVLAEARAQHAHGVLHTSGIQQQTAWMPHRLHQLHHWCDIHLWEQTTAGPDVALSAVVTGLDKVTGKKVSRGRLPRPRNAKKRERRVGTRTDWIYGLDMQ